MKYHGVRWDKYNWCAYIGHQNKMLHLGMFKTAKQAARAYDSAAIKYHGDKAKLNFGRLITVHEEQIYRLCSPDFFGLPYGAAAKLMHMTKSGIYNAMKRIKKKCPSLFPLWYLPVGVPLSYKLWMDNQVKQQF